MTVIVHTPPTPAHDCGVNSHGYWFRYERLEESSIFYAMGRRYCSKMINQHDPDGTVRACKTCGTTWVGYRSAESGILVTRWRREGWFARWRRMRRQLVEGNDLHVI